MLAVVKASMVALMTQSAGIVAMNEDTTFIDFGCVLCGDYVPVFVVAAGPSLAKNREKSSFGTRFAQAAAIRNSTPTHLASLANRLPRIQ